MRVVGVIGLAALAVLVSASSASAWAAWGPHWCGTMPRNVYIYENVGGDHLRATRIGWRAWTASPTNVLYKLGSQASHDVQITSANYGLTGWSGLTVPTVDGANCFISALVKLNNLYMVGWSLEHKINLVAHELGHVQGLAHSTNPDSVMYSVDNFGTRPYIVPVFDDVEGARNLYGLLQSSLPDTSTYLGTVTRDGNGYPTNVQVNSAGVGHNAFASTPYILYGSYTRIVVTEGFITPQTAYRGAYCVCYTKNPGASTNRMYNLEVDNDSFRITWTKPDNTLGIVTFGGAPTVGTQYYAILAVYNQDGAGTPYAYAYVFRASDAVEVGHAGYVSGTRWTLNGSDTYAQGVGAWTDTSSNPASNYNLGRQWADHS